MQNNTAKVDEAVLSVPDGGIGAFIMDDDEIEQAYGDDEDYGSEGIAQFPALTKKMAAMGREGDDVIAHLQSGELVIPAAFLDGNPQMRDTIFAFLEAQGVEDPQRYVVGSDANSINPVTGAPEFFKFIKKAFKKVVKGVKKVVKGVVKVLKKVAPVVLPIALNFLFPGMGAIAAGALGSGIGTLIQGGSMKDALKSALIGGITGGVASGVGGAISGEGFMAGVRQGFTGTPGMGFFDVNPSVKSFFGGANASPSLSTSGAGTQPSLSSKTVADAAIADSGVASGALTAADGSLVTGQEVAKAATRPATFGENIKDAFTPGGKSFTQSMGDAFFPKAPTLDTTAIGNKAYTSAYKNAIDLGISETAASQIGIKAMDNAISSATAAAAPSLLRTYGPLALAGTAVAAGTGMFTPVPGEEPGLVEYGEDGRPITGTDLVRADPTKYLVSDLGSIVLNPETGQYESRASTSVSDLYPTYQMPTDYSVPTTFAANTQAPFLMGSTPGGPFARPYVVQAAEGGAIFPRRNGGIMPDEGIPGKDSVRAMLMPGEFVMTTDAVRGFGNGNLNNGIKNMYSVMRNLEGRGRAMA